MITSVSEKSKVSSLNELALERARGVVILSSVSIPAIISAKVPLDFELEEDSLCIGSLSLILLYMVYVKI